MRWRSLPMTADSIQGTASKMQSRGSGGDICRKSHAYGPPQTGRITAVSIRRHLRLLLLQPPLSRLKSNENSYCIYIFVRTAV